MGFVEHGILLSEMLIAKHTVKLAPEPDGPTCAVVSAGADSESPLFRLTALGDSMVAGCGVESTEQSLIADIAHLLSERLSRPVEWSIDGKLGATMRRVRYRQIPALAEKARTSGQKFDVLIVCAGSNDLMAQRSNDEWRDDLTAVVSSAKSLATHVVVFSAGQLYKSPSLGRALRHEVERRTDAQTAISKEVCAATGADYIDLTHEPLRADESDFWSSDHFHPSALGYSLIAHAAVEKMSATA